MPVIDASTVIEILIGGEAGARWRDAALRDDVRLYAPHLIDIEVTSGLRRSARARTAFAVRAANAYGGFADFRLVRCGHLVLLPRIWELRHNGSASDAAYIALAETLGEPLLTSDARLSRAQGHDAGIVLLQ